MYNTEAVICRGLTSTNNFYLFCMDEILAGHQALAMFIMYLDEGQDSNWKYPYVL